MCIRDRNIILDEITLLAEDGLLKPADMLKGRITRERLLAELRSSNIKNLAQIQRTYMEANDNFSIVKFQHKEKDNLIGLCILPDFDSEYRQRFSFSDHEFACRSCGNVADEKASHDKCVNCGAKEWEAAMVGNSIK